MAGRKSRRDGMTLAEVVAHYEDMAVRTESGCLELRDVSRNPKGYPTAVYVGTKRIRPVGHMVLAHYREAKQPRRDGVEMSHSCHNRLCIAVEHLAWETHRQNLVRMVQAGRQHCQKLSVEDVRGIRWLVKLGWPQAEVARMMGVGPPQIHRIVTRQEWAHVD